MTQDIIDHGESYKAGYAKGYADGMLHNEFDTFKAERGEIDKCPCGGKLEVFELICRKCGTTCSPDVEQSKGEG